MTSICLCMIVRDEAAVIERCLESVKPYIDRWVIVDTGSTDDTVATIAEALQGVPGRLEHREWVSFGHNRSELLQLARGCGDYLLLMDADWTLEVEDASAFDRAADSYLVHHECGDLDFWNKRLVKADLAWQYHGAVHEYMAAPDEQTCEKLHGVTIHVEGSGGRDRGRWVEDERMLRAELDQDPENTRARFYLAQTLRDMGRTDEAGEQYVIRAEAGGWDEEVFYSLYQAGVLQQSSELLLRAWNYRPQRAEPLYHLALQSRLAGRHHSALLFSGRGKNIVCPGDVLFVEPWIYEWGLLFEYSIAAYWTGDHEGSRWACDLLLDRPTLPAIYRDQVAINRRYSSD